MVKGGSTLRGEILPGGAKNAILPMMAASILSDTSLRLRNVPELEDVNVFGKILQQLGGSVEKEGDMLTLDQTGVNAFDVPYGLATKLRASVLLLGPLLARFGVADIPIPGGCDIGDRPIDQHLKALTAMGARCVKEHGKWHVAAAALNGARIDFDLKTVTGTENVLIAACCARGETVINNAALEPEVVDLARCLKNMGARIEGEGTSTIRVEGVTSLNGTDYTVMPDRIEAATLLLAGALTGGDVKVLHISPEILESLLGKLKESGADVSWDEKGVRVIRGDTIRSVNVSTNPFPGFPTDVQAQFMAYMCLGDSTSTIEENIFENRFRHVAELRRLGADISVSGRVAVVKGVRELSGAPVTATDLRASASLVLAGIVADSETLVKDIEHLDRGYEKLEEKLNSLGASIRRVPEEDECEVIC
ncbi:MAG: UDP-N-acetylglucosamine 1-carboxyvinyltransferase [Deltaproteobacteria bacterium]|nr:UDP-N-acetylglucosamine 1-carboxyvinyltransferase [Deltaproteobacteria bacterium]